MLLPRALEGREKSVSPLGIASLLAPLMPGSSNSPFCRESDKAGKPFSFFLYFLFFSFAAAAKKKRSSETHRGPWIFIVESSGPHEISTAVDMGPNKTMRRGRPGHSVEEPSYSAHQARRGWIIIVSAYLPVADFANVNAKEQKHRLIELHTTAVHHSISGRQADARKGWWRGPKSAANVQASQPPTP
ncbi:uncharacterized protein TrAFT101_001015 [Trichoderma asperellum]|uniref:uncharacterized protein n=1 Tax=Trichoderma asperellum TaxID=101201 RepID=UPI00332EFF40|nr:hypothetical protein TrAFT101_001015 [Trichoderma asperellum]